MPGITGRSFVTVGLAALVLTGCTGPDADGAERAAGSFAALAQNNPAAACALLSPQTRQAVEQQAKTGCSTALPDTDLPAPSSPRSSDVYGHDARVVTGDDTLFLARFEGGWLVTAAGCVAVGADAPYECAVSGG